MKLIESDKIENIVCKDVEENEVMDIINNKVPEIANFIIDLNKKLKGIICMGLAAIQVGDFRKYFVRYYNKNSWIVFFNCKYINNCSSRIQSKEGCFSYNLGRDINTVRRWKSIILFHDLWIPEKKKFLRKQKVKFKGEDAIVIQHETDHLHNHTIFNQ